MEFMGNILLNGNENNWKSHRFRGISSDRVILNTVYNNLYQTKMIAKANKDLCIF